MKKQRLVHNIGPYNSTALQYSAPNKKSIERQGASSYFVGDTIWTPSLWAPNNHVSPFTRVRLHTSAECFIKKCIDHPDCTYWSTQTRRKCHRLAHPPIARHPYLAEPKHSPAEEIATPNRALLTYSNTLFTSRIALLFSLIFVTSQIRYHWQTDNMLNNT